MPFKNKSEHTLADCGLFIGFTTLPISNRQTFVENEIIGVFNGYKEGLHRHLLDNKNSSNQKAKGEFDKYMYKPRCYTLLGNFDLAVISFVDDFQFATQKFHPFNEILLKNSNHNDEYFPSNYTYQVMSCAIPDIKSLGIDEIDKFDIENIYTRTIGNDKLPFIGITSLKINNHLLIGNGLFLVELIYKELWNILNNKFSDEIKYIITDSFSWNEINILFFANSFVAINAVIQKIRELSLDNLKSVYTSDEKIQYIKEKALGNNFKIKGNIGNSHLFVTTHTVFGFDKVAINEQHYKENINLHVKLSVKPGHKKEVLKQIDEFEKKYDVSLNQKQSIVGKSDFAFILNEDDAFEKYLKLHKFLFESDELNYKKHLRKINTLIGFNNENEQFEENKEDLFFAEFKNKLCFQPAEIYKLLEDLRSLRVSKITREKILNMYVAFNDGIADPVLYGYFIELKAMLRDILLSISNMTKGGIEKSVEDITDTLESIINDFSVAHLNRFGQSYVMNEITDYNIEFNGGIQNLVSAYDFAYKSIVRQLGDTKMLSFITVTGVPMVKSNQYTAKINYFHLFHPVIFASQLVHEAANYYIERITSIEKDDFYLEKINNILSINELPIIDPKRDKEEEIQYLERCLSGLEEAKSHIDEKIANDIINKLRKEIVIIEYKKYSQDDVENKNAVIKYFLIDILTLKIAFNDNFSAFYEWHFNCYAQSSIYYNKDGTLTNAVIEFLQRMILISRYSDNENFFKGRFFAPFKQYQSQWHLNFVKSNSMIEKEYLANDRFVKYFENCQEFANIVFSSFEWTKESIEAINSDELSEEKREQEKLKPEEFALMSSLMNIFAKKSKEEFEKGNVFFTPIDIDINLNTVFCNSIFCGFRILIEELIGESKILLERDDKNKVCMPSINDYTLAWDSQGGMFTLDYETRRKIMKYNIALIKSLWHLGHIQKKSYFK